MSGDGPAPHYPLFLNLSGRTVVVVGDGAPVERKASAFLRYGADVVVISPEASDLLREMEADGLIAVEQREYRRGDLDGVALVVCAGASDEVSRAVARDADARGCPVNVAGLPEHSNYLIPTSLRRGPLQIAISTSGAAPLVARRLRDEIKASYGEEWGAYVTLLGSVRALAFERISDAEERDRLLDEVASADLLSRIVADESLDAETVLEEFATGDADSRETGDAANAASADAEPELVQPQE